MFELIGFKWGDGLAGRTGGEVTWSMSLVGLRYNTALLSDIELADFETAIQAAFDRWQGLADINFRRVEDSDDAMINVDMAPLSSPTIGLATSFFFDNDLTVDPIGLLDSSEIDFGIDETWAPFGEAGELNFFAVALHEIGHAFGLEHVNDTTQILNPFIATDDLGSGDIDGVRALYGDRTVGTNGNNTLNEIAASSGQMIDGLGGTDIIGGSNFNDFIHGGAGNDIINGNSGDDVIVDTDGTNTVNGDGGDDVILGGFGTLTADGGDNADVIVGGVGNDILLGGSGNDLIIGDPDNGFFFGNDTLTAGSGTDHLEGGLGADTFVFSISDGSNTIADYNFDRNDPDRRDIVGQDFEVGVDRIDLTDFAGYDDFDDIAAQLTPVTDGTRFSDQGTTILIWGVDLDELSGSDFIL